MFKKDCTYLCNLQGQSYIGLLIPCIIVYDDVELKGREHHRCGARPNVRSESRIDLDQLESANVSQ